MLANPWFGTVVSESGGAYTWCENAHGYRLTPWQNDAVSDPSGEAFYLRDEDEPDKAVEISARATSPPIGMPDAMPLAVSRMSGSTPQ